ncbi:MAG: MBL fold metallo-hydrolase [Verrucomicrobiales bacterium]|nr:MBL fold metallo-hydrolase [Verrucomicrobiales bacterium]
MALVFPAVVSDAATASHLRPGPVQTRTEERPAVRQPAADNEQPPAKIPNNATEVRFYGHGFLYMITSSGIRIALDPFTNDPRVGYTFPEGLPADIVLISAEVPELSGNDAFSGLPQVFRSLTGLGMNNANGIEFHGVATYRDSAGQTGSLNNTSYVVELDRVVFCNLGVIGRGLDRRQTREIGRVDVLFLPVGNTDLSVAELWEIVGDTRAKWVVPIRYRTATSALTFSHLRTLDEFLSAPESAKIPRVKLLSSEYLFNHKKLPKETTLLLYQSP